MNKDNSLIVVFFLCKNDNNLLRAPLEGRFSMTIAIYQRQMAYEDVMGLSIYFEHDLTSEFHFFAITRSTYK